MRTAADLPEQLRDLIVSGRDAWQLHDYDRATSLFTDALTIARETRSTFGEAAALHFLGNVAFNRCDDAEARRLHSRALELSRADGDEQGIATSLGSIAMIDVAEVDFDSAERNFAAAIETYERVGMEQAADALRATRDALVVRRVPIADVVARNGTPQ
jgi:tetratricopeptide (TPR) repeat protein